MVGVSVVTTVSMRRFMIGVYVVVVMVGVNPKERPDPMIFCACELRAVDVVVSVLPAMNVLNHWPIVDANGATRVGGGPRFGILVFISIVPAVKVGDDSV